MTSAQLGRGFAGRSGVAAPPVPRRPVLTVVAGGGGRRPGSTEPAISRGDESHRAAARPAPPLRLTRRGRRLVAALALAIGIGLAGVVATVVLDGGSDALQLAGNSSVVVRSGDTLWSIAGTVAPEADTRAVVDAIVAANDLDGVGLVPGQVLRLP